jgi:4'-phosphopantetheinyl transferase
MKWLGDGMSIPLDSFCFKVDDYGIDVADEHRSIKPFFKQFSIDGYKLSLCSTFDNFQDKIETLIVEEMIF